MIDFKFEVGAFYRRRDGIKAECLKINCKNVPPILLHCEVLDTAFSYYVYNSGNHFFDESTCTADIVGIWGEPKPKRLCYRNNNSGVIGMLTEEEIKQQIYKASLELFPCCLDEV